MSLRCPFEIVWSLLHPEGWIILTLDLMKMYACLIIATELDAAAENIEVWRFFLVMGNNGLQLACKDGHLAIMVFSYVKTIENIDFREWKYGRLFHSCR